MRCLLFGGGGFIGSYICDKLLEAGYEVRVFEKKGFCNKNLLHILNKIEIVEGDFNLNNDLLKAVDGIDIIFHLVSTTVPQNSNVDPVKDMTDNVIPTLNLLDIVRARGIKKIIFLSSGGTIYGVPDNVPISEDHPTNPICSYGIHKLTIEKYLVMYNKLYNLDYAVLRVANPYGERQNPQGSQGAVGIFIKKALNNETIEIWGDGEIVRDYLYVGDVADAALKAITCDSHFKVFNIGSGQGLSLNNIIQEIEKTLDCHLSVTYLERRKFDVSINVLDISRAEHALGWKPTTTFSKGLRKTICSFIHSEEK